MNIPFVMVSRARWVLTCHILDSIISAEDLFRKIRRFILAGILLAATSTASLCQPQITTLPPESVKARSVIFRATCNPNGFETAIRFQFGLTRYYGVNGPVQPIGSDSQDHDVSVPFQGLSPSTKYHVRAVTFNPNSLNITSCGEDQMFTTRPDSQGKGFAVQLQIEDTGGTHVGGIAWFGIHSNATYCIDPEFGESEMPPPPPGSNPRIEFVDPHTESYACLGSGTRVDIRQYRDSAQVDTYLVEFDPGSIGYPVKISWPNLSNYYSGSASIMRVDMKSHTSIVITNRLSYLFIIVKHPSGLISVWPDSVDDTHIHLAARFDPGGQPTEGWFEWGPTSAYGSTSSPIAIGSGPGEVTFRQTIEGLFSRQDYHFRAVIRNATGTVTSVDQLVTTVAGTDTLNPPGIAYTSYELVTDTSSQLRSMFATNGSDTYAWFEYGTTIAYGSTISEQYVGTGWIFYSISSVLNGLTPRTSYHFRAVARNHDGTTYGPDASFTTLAELAKPGVETLEADSITANSARLRAWVNPKGSRIWVKFEVSGDTWIPTPPAQEFGPDTAGFLVTALESNLSPDATYSFWARAGVVAGGIGDAMGGSRTFTTLPDSTYGGFKLTLTLVGNSGEQRRIAFGVHNHATICEDYSLGETTLPPAPPSNAMDLRFIDPSSSGYPCFGLGLNPDLRHYESSSQIDTYRIFIQPGAAWYPVTLKWREINSHYHGPVLLIDETGDSLVNVDMKRDSALTLTRPIGTLLLIAQGPANILTSLTALTPGTTATLRGRFNPDGEQTSAWFEWGPDSTHVNRTESTDLGNGTAPVDFAAVVANLETQQRYFFRPVSQNVSGVFYGFEQSFVTSGPPKPGNKPDQPATFALYQSYPNPFNPTTFIRYSLMVYGHATLKVYNMLGTEVAVLVDELKQPGTYAVPWDGGNLPSGIYFYKLLAGGLSDVKKMALIR